MSSIFVRNQPLLAHLVGFCHNLASVVRPSVLFLSFPLRPLGQIKIHLSSRIYVKSLIKFLHFIPIRHHTWPHWWFFLLTGRFMKKSSPMKPLANSQKDKAHSRYVVFFIVLFLMGLYFKELHFCKPLDQMELSRNVYQKSSIKFVHFVSIVRNTWLPWTIIFFWLAANKKFFLQNLLLKTCKSKNINRKHFVDMGIFVFDWLIY